MKILKEEFHGQGGNLQFDALEGRKYVTIRKYGRDDMSVKVEKSEYNKFMEGDFEEDIKTLEDAFCYFGS